MSEQIAVIEEQNPKITLEKDPEAIEEKKPIEEMGKKLNIEKETRLEKEKLEQEQKNNPSVPTNVKAIDAETKKMSPGIMIALIVGIVIIAIIAIILIIPIMIYILGVFVAFICALFAQKKYTTKDFFRPFRHAWLSWFYVHVYLKPYY